MIRSFYTAGTGMIVERSRMNTIGNNLVNVETQGYKKDTLLTRSFRDMLISRLNDPSLSGNDNPIGGLNTGVYADEVITDFTQGSLEQTNIKTDMAIVGDAFFSVMTPDGERYTRAGNFTLDVNGFLVDNYGNFVMSESNTNINIRTHEFSITESGGIYNMETNTLLGSLKLTSFENTGELRKEGENLFYDDGEANPQASETSTVLQGYLEASNVNTAQEMVNMIISSRAYETNQRVLRVIDETLQRTVNDIARF